MATLAIGSDGVVWPPSWVRGIDEVIAEVLYRLRAPRGTIPGDSTAGLPYRSWWATPPTAGQVEAAIRSQAEAVAGVIQSTVTASVSGESVAASVTLTIEVDGTTVQRTLSTEVYAGIPAAWYLRVGGY
jgi:hypothetical protein